DGGRHPGPVNGPEPSRSADGAGRFGAPRGHPAPGTAADPDARQAARRFLAICLEVLNGYRPLAHIRPLVNPAEVETVLAQLTTGVERLARLRRAGKRAPARLRVVRVCEPRPGAVEAAAVLGDAGRTWALAFRLERRQGRWVGTAVRVL
ncbi:MAG TPA: Rv3235 family protein, partial [Micromonosporaceae bacterium]|nr:Rv3235 family protein [Micromonosporaceae bacterium]